MKVLASALRLSLIFAATQCGMSEPVTASTLIHVVNPIHSRGYLGLIEATAANALPLGIVLDASPETGTCSHHFDLPAGDIPLSSLIRVINSSFPNHRAMLRNGVLEITPWPLPPHVGDFLNLKLDHFRSNADTDEGHSVSLWMWVRAVIAPHEGTAYEGFSSSHPETVQPLELREQSVEAILNDIAGLGKGGLWILRAADLKTLSPSTPIPFMVYDYVGSQPGAQGVLACH
jgi:hypothetical protein